MKSQFEQAQNNINEILSLKTILDSLNPLKEWNDIFKEKIIKEITYHSNKIEGNKLSYGETIELIEKNILPKNRSIKDILEIKNHFLILSKIFDNINFPITEISIKDLHKDLMEDSKQWDYESFYSPGKYKFRENYSLRPSGNYFKFANPDDVPKLMKNLMEQINHFSLNKDKSILENNPLYISTLFHAKFTEIHPFDDGNGRIARLISNMIIMKEEYPPIIIKEEQREIYLETLYKSTDQKDLLPLFNYFSECLIESINNKIDYFKKEIDIKNKDIDINRGIYL